MTMDIVFLFIKSNILSLHLFRHLQKAEACIAPYDYACKSKPSFNTIKQYLKPDFCKGTFWNIYFLLENVDKHPYIFLEIKKNESQNFQFDTFPEPVTPTSSGSSATVANLIPNAILLLFYLTYRWTNLNKHYYLSILCKQRKPGKVLVNTTPWKKKDLYLMITSAFGIFHLLYSYVLFFRLIIDCIFALLILLEMSIFILETADIWISLYLLFFHEIIILKCMYACIVLKSHLC